MDEFMKDAAVEQINTYSQGILFIVQSLGSREGNYKAEE